MTTVADIGWGAYGGYEGPFFKGSEWLKLPANPSAAFKRVYVSSSSEGGFDSINGYDKCCISIGMNQACEQPWMLTSDLLTTIAETNADLLKPLHPALEASGAEFKAKRPGKWRFYFLDARGEVDAGAEQRQLFQRNSSGKMGSWDPESKTHAKLWAASLANLLVQPAAKEAQVVWAARRISAYAMPDAKKVLFDGAGDDGWVGAFRAAYLSYALNIPVKADKMLKQGLKTAPGKKWSPEWCTHLLKVITFESGVAIWPHRYEAIRKHLEKLYGVDIPDTSEDLKAWKVAQGLAEDHDAADIYDEDPEASGKEPTFTTTKEIQAHLLSMGYDLGPWGADGNPGRKTRDAIRTFQRLNGLGADGIVGPQTRAKLLETWRAKVCA
jgi:hypothetical protein